MEVREDEIGNLGWLYSGAGQGSLEAFFILGTVIEAVDARHLLVKFVACSVINQICPTRIQGTDKKAPHGHGNAVLGVGRELAGPQGFGDHAEHGATVEPKVAGFDPVQLKRAEAHPSVILYGARRGDA